MKDCKICNTKFDNEQLYYKHLWNDHNKHLWEKQKKRKKEEEEEEEEKVKCKTCWYNNLTRVDRHYCQYTEKILNEIPLYKKLKTENVTLKTENVTLKTENETFNTENETLKIENNNKKEVDEENIKLKIELENSKNYIDIKEKIDDQEIDGLFDTENALQKKNEQIKQVYLTNTELKQMVVLNENKNNELKNENNEIKSKNKIFEVRAEINEKLLNDSERTNIFKLQNENKELRSKIGFLNQEIERLKADIELKEKEIDDIYSDNEEYIN